MKILKRILIGLGVLILLVVVAGYLSPGTRQITRSKEIAAPPGQLFDLVDHYPSSVRWSAWHEMDPNMVVEYGLPDRGPGAWYSWKSEKSEVGYGKMTTLQTNRPQSIRQELRFQDYDPSFIDIQFQPKNPKLTEVSMTMNLVFGNSPIMRLMGAMGVMDAFMKKDFDRSLTKLDSVARADQAHLVPAAPADSSATMPATSAQ